MFSRLAQLLSSTILSLAPALATPLTLVTLATLGQSELGCLGGLALLYGNVHTHFLHT